MIAEYSNDIEASVRNMNVCECACVHFLQKQPILSL